MPSLTLRRLWTDEDSMLQVEFVAENGVHRAAQDVFVYPDELRALGEELRTYPASPDHEIVYEYGDLPDTYAHLRLRVFPLRPTGHSAIEFKFDNRKALPDKAEGLLYLPCEPAVVHRIGRLLIGFGDGRRDGLRHEWRAE